MKRNINGILLLDKPTGMTSNDALQKVKHLYQARKAGHTGSLDPLATGMLPICFGEATKFSRFLLEANKKYLVTGKLGVITASGDVDSEIIEEREIGRISDKKIEKVLMQFRGKISQVPSMFSAIKHQGQPLYKLARQGIEIEREPREVTIYNLELLAFQAGLVKLAVSCSKGTYIRTLVADIGEALGCGAHVVELRRPSVDPYREDQLIKLDALYDLFAKRDFATLNALLLPIETMLTDWNEVQLSEDMIYYLNQGGALIVPHAPTSGWVKLKSKSGDFLGVGEILPDGKVAPRRLIHHAI